ncbi:unnamed protein product [Ectocarpus sp. CCAP 1310/34]|nr:unnamed protein product [Ectocarpus sp. CCAP 1310/34]
MALVLHSYASPFTDQLQLRERLFTIDGKLLKIQQAWKGDGKGGTDIGFGASVYPAAYVLAEYLERHPYLVRGKRVIELGTGTGFLGIAAATLGAAEVCLTDGDEESLKLTQRNVTGNLSPAVCRRSPSTASCCDQQQAQAVTAADKERTPCNADSTAGSTNIVESPVDRRPPLATAATVSVQQLRWGCADDMHAVGVPRRGDGDSGSPRAWDVVLGSDIAALPYASAYGDLLQTIVSLVNITDGSGQDKHTAPSPPRTIADHVTGADQNTEISSTAAPDSCEPLDGSGRESGTGKPAITKTSAMKGVMAEAGRSGSEREGRRQVVVLLAHKRRHISEEAFFEDLKEELGGERSVRGTSEDDIHPDFRGTGIRLHMFVVDV